MKELEIVFLPYISLNQERQIGDVIFWPYHKEKEKYLKNIDGAISRLDKIANCYKNFYDNAPLKNIVAVSLQENLNLEPLSKQDREKIVEAINLFSYLWTHKIQSLSSIFFDNFIFHFYKINLEKDTGGMNLISRRGFNLIDIDHIQFQTPHHIIIDRLDNNFPSEFATTLGELFSIAAGLKSDQQEEAKRIIRAVNWFNQSKFIEPLITDQVMLVSLCVALETLLGIQQYSRKSEELSHSIQLLLGENKKITDWAASFYDRRNKILHGRRIESLDYGEHSSHITLAQIVFDYCLKTKLFLMNLWPKGTNLQFILFHPLEYYLVDNRSRVNEMLKYTLDELQNQEKAMSFLKLSWGLNTDTDLSGDKEFYKKAIQGVAKIIMEGLKEIENQKEKYSHKIENFEQEFQGINSTIERIINGEVDLANQLQPADVFVGNLDITEYKLKAKHIQIAYGMLITDFYYLLNNLYELYEKKKYKL